MSVDKKPVLSSIGYESNCNQIAGVMYSIPVLDTTSDDVIGAINIFISSTSINKAIKQSLASLSQMSYIIDVNNNLVAYYSNSNEIVTIINDDGTPILANSSENELIQISSSFIIGII
jgi:hypothetical protein